MPTPASQSSPVRSLYAKHWLQWSKWQKWFQFYRMGLMCLVLAIPSIEEGTGVIYDFGARATSAVSRRAWSAEDVSTVISNQSSALAARASAAASSLASHIVEDGLASHAFFENKSLRMECDGVNESYKWKEVFEDVQHWMASTNVPFFPYVAAHLNIHNEHEEIATPRHTTRDDLDERMDDDDDGGALACWTQTCGVLVQSRRDIFMFWEGLACWIDCQDVLAQQYLISPISRFYISFCKFEFKFPGSFLPYFWQIYFAQHAHEGLVGALLWFFGFCISFLASMLLHYSFIPILFLFRVREDGESVCTASPWALRRWYQFSIDEDEDDEISSFRRIDPATGEYLEEPEDLEDLEHGKCFARMVVRQLVRILPTVLIIQFGCLCLLHALLSTMLGLTMYSASTVRHPEAALGGKQYSWALDRFETLSFLKVPFLSIQLSIWLEMSLIIFVLYKIWAVGVSLSPHVTRVERDWNAWIDQFPEDEWRGWTWRSLHTCYKKAKDAVLLLYIYTAFFFGLTLTMLILQLFIFLPAETVIASWTHGVQWSCTKSRSAMMFGWLPSQSPYFFGAIYLVSSVMHGLLQDKVAYVIPDGGSPDVRANMCCWSEQASAKTMLLFLFTAIMIDISLDMAQSIMFFCRGQPYFGALNVLGIFIQMVFLLVNAARGRQNETTFAQALLQSDSLVHFRDSWDKGFTLSCFHEKAFREAFGETYNSMSIGVCAVFTVPLFYVSDVVLLFVSLLLSLHSISNGVAEALEYVTAETEQERLLGKTQFQGFETRVILPNHYYQHANYYKLRSLSLVKMFRIAEALTVVSTLCICIACSSVRTTMTTIISLNIIAVVLVVLAFCWYQYVRIKLPRFQPPAQKEQQDTSFSGPGRDSAREACFPCTCLKFWTTIGKLVTSLALLLVFGVGGTLLIAIGLFISSIYFAATNFLMYSGSLVVITNPYEVDEIFWNDVRTTERVVSFYALFNYFSGFTMTIFRKVLFALILWTFLLLSVPCPQWSPFDLGSEVKRLFQDMIHDSGPPRALAAVKFMIMGGTFCGVFVLVITSWMLKRYRFNWYKEDVERLERVLEDIHELKSALQDIPGCPDELGRTTSNAEANPLLLILLKIVAALDGDRGKMIKVAMDFTAVQLKELQNSLEQQARKKEGRADEPILESKDRPWVLYGDDGRPALLRRIEYFQNQVAAAIERGQQEAEEEERKPHNQGNLAGFTVPDGTVLECRRAIRWLEEKDKKRGKEKESEERFQRYAHYYTCQARNCNAFRQCQNCKDLQESPAGSLKASLQDTAANRVLMTLEMGAPRDQLKELLYIAPGEFIASCIRDLLEAAVTPKSVERPTELAKHIMQMHDQMFSVLDAGATIPGLVLPIQKALKQVAELIQKTHLFQFAPDEVAPDIRYDALSTSKHSAVMSHVESLRRATQFFQKGMTYTETLRLEAGFAYDDFYASHSFNETGHAGMLLGHWEITSGIVCSIIRRGGELLCLIEDRTMEIRLRENRWEMQWDKDGIELMLLDSEQSTVDSLTWLGTEKTKTHTFTWHHVDEMEVTRRRVPWQNYAVSFAELQTCHKLSESECQSIWQTCPEVSFRAHTIAETLLVSGSGLPYADGTYTRVATQGLEHEIRRAGIVVYLQEPPHDHRIVYCDREEQQDAERQDGPAWYIEATSSARRIYMRSLTKDDNGELSVPLRGWKTYYGPLSLGRSPAPFLSLKTSETGYTDSHGEPVHFVVDGARLIKYVNGVKEVGGSDNSGVVKSLHYFGGNPAILYDQYGYGSDGCPWPLVAKLKQIADELDLPNNLPQVEEVPGNFRIGDEVEFIAASFDVDERNQGGEGTPELPVVEVLEEGEACKLGLTPLQQEEALIAIPPSTELAPLTLGSADSATSELGLTGFVPTAPLAPSAMGSDAPAPAEPPISNFLSKLPAMQFGSPASFPGELPPAAAELALFDLPVAPGQRKITQVSHAGLHQHKLVNGQRGRVIGRGACNLDEDRILVEWRPTLRLSMLCNAIAKVEKRIDPWLDSLPVTYREMVKLLRKRGCTEAQCRTHWESLEHEKADEFKFRFSPGELGLSFAQDGRIASLAYGLQAQSKGVQASMVCRTIDGQRFSVEVLDAKIAGRDDYEAVFVFGEAQAFAQGELVEVWSDTHKSWKAGSIEHKFLADGLDDRRRQVSAGTLLVMQQGLREYITPKEIKRKIRKGLDIDAQHDLFGEWRYAQTASYRLVPQEGRILFEEDFHNKSGSKTKAAGELLLKFDVVGNRAFTGEVFVNGELRGLIWLTLTSRNQMVYSFRFAGEDAWSFNTLAYRVDAWMTKLRVMTKNTLRAKALEMGIEDSSIGKEIFDEELIKLILAREAHVPKHWMTGWDCEYGRPYYWNAVTGESLWEFPTHAGGYIVGREADLPVFATKEHDSSQIASVSTGTTVDVLEVDLVAELGSTVARIASPAGWIMTRNGSGRSVVRDVAKAGYVWTSTGTEKMPKSVLNHAGNPHAGDAVTEATVEHWGQATLESWAQKSIVMKTHPQAASIDFECPQGHLLKLGSGKYDSLMEKLIHLQGGTYFECQICCRLTSAQELFFWCRQCSWMRCTLCSATEASTTLAVPLLSRVRHRSVPSVVKKDSLGILVADLAQQASGRLRPGDLGTVTSMYNQKNDKRYFLVTWDRTEKTYAVLKDKFLELVDVIDEDAPPKIARENLMGEWISIDFKTHSVIMGSAGAELGCMGADGIVSPMHRTDGRWLLNGYALDVNKSAYDLLTWQNPSSDATVTWQRPNEAIYYTKRESVEVRYSAEEEWVTGEITDLDPLKVDGCEVIFVRKMFEFDGELEGARPAPPPPRRIKAKKKQRCCIS